MLFKNIYTNIKKVFVKLLLRIEDEFSFRWWKLLLYLEPKLPLQNIILLESIPDMSDNTKAVFDEMLRRKLNRKYTLVWVLHDSLSKPPRHYRVRYCGIYSKADKFYQSVAKAKISCNRCLFKNRPEQFCFYLSHGTVLKSVKNYYRIPEGIDTFLTASEHISDMQAREINSDLSKAVALGYPRNDILCCGTNINIREILDTSCKKVIVWYPTYRQHKNGFTPVSTNALPIIHSETAAKKLNIAAQESDILIVLKPHFVQDVTDIKNLNLSNIRFIDDDFFIRHNIHSYELLASCDALITDYSSVYYDFTLCDKPIAAVWEDIEEYKESPGLVENYEFLLQGAEKVYTVEDLIAFLQRVGSGIDLLQAERREIRDFSNISTDGKSSKRVVDYIEKALKTIGRSN